MSTSSKVSTTEDAPPTPAAIVARCTELEAENHKLHLQVLVLREALVAIMLPKGASSGNQQGRATLPPCPALSESERKRLLETFLAAGGYAESNNIPDGICDVCFRKGPTHLCTQCRRASFCSVECEVAVLKTHVDF